MRKRQRTIKLFSRLNVKQKSMLLGLLLSAPALFLIVSTFVSNSQLGNLVRQTIFVNEQNEQMLTLVEKLDDIQLMQARVSRLASQVALARYEPYMDEYLYPEIERLIDGISANARDLVYFYTRPTFYSQEQLILANSLLYEASLFRNNLVFSMQQALSRHVDIARQYADIFLSQQNLVRYYQKELISIEDSMETVLVGRQVALVALYSLRLARQKYIHTFENVLLDTTRPYLDERYNYEFNQERAQLYQLLKHLSAYNPQLAAAYIAFLTDLENIEKNDLREALTAWSVERGDSEVEILKIEQKLNNGADLIIERSIQLATVIHEQIRVSADERSSTLLKLRNLGTSVFWIAALMGVLSVVFTLVLYKVFEYSLVQPLLGAARFAQDIRSGRQPEPLLEDRQDEFGTLAQALNLMHEEVSRKETELLDTNKSLESRVEERTQHLTVAMEALKSTQDKLILQGKLATLGQLSASMAHELNTPIGAIISAERSLDDFFHEEMPEILQSISLLSTEESDWFQSLLRNMEHDHIDTGTSPRTVRRELTSRFSELGAKEPEAWAEVLVDCGIKIVEKVWPAPIPEEKALDLLKLLAQLVTQHRMVQVVKDASGKASFAVSTLRTYLHGSTHDEPTRFNLANEIRTVLQLLREKIGDQVELILELDESLEISGVRQSLSQVWTNLISNALQAMDHAGSLHIRIMRDGPMAKIQVIDSGCGIPPELKEKIFEPFFTTKITGEGVGLGLDICQVIVKRHDGRIELESEPGNTVFTVILPITEEGKDSA